MNAHEQKHNSQKPIRSTDGRRNEYVGFVALSRNNDVIAIESTPDRAYSAAIVSGDESPRVVQYEYLEQTN